MYIMTFKQMLNLLKLIRLWRKSKPNLPERKVRALRDIAWDIKSQLVDYPEPETVDNADMLALVSELIHEDTL